MLPTAPLEYTTRMVKYFKSHSNTHAMLSPGDVVYHTPYGITPHNRYETPPSFPLHQIAEGGHSNQRRVKVSFFWLKRFLNDGAPLAHLNRKSSAFHYFFFPRIFFLFFFNIQLKKAMCKVMGTQSAPLQVCQLSRSSESTHFVFAFVET